MRYKLSPRVTITGGGFSKEEEEVCQDGMRACVSSSCVLGRRAALAPFGAERPCVPQSPASPHEAGHGRSRRGASFTLSWPVAARQAG